jgi:hypothetical protein
VNRLWQHHLGRGIVSTPSEFGARGEPPSHPELLDWLARELIRNGWRLKPIHKLIVTSAVYMQDCALDETNYRADPNNRLFWRRRPTRLEAEIIRDAILSASGSLDLRMFGPGTLDESSRRRSVYFTVKRSQIVPVLQVFDEPDALQGIGERPTTTIAPQALLLLNNVNVREYARTLARRIAPRDESSFEKAIGSAFARTLSRPPTGAEIADGVAFLKQQTDSYASASSTSARELALANFCQALMCLNEFVYVE